MKLILTKLDYYYEWKEFKKTIEYLLAASFIIIGIELFFVNEDLAMQALSLVTIVYSLFMGFMLSVYFLDKHLKKQFGLDEPKKPLRIKKQIKFYIKLHKQDLLEKLLLVTISLAIFLPVRLLYYNYVSHFFGANIGILSIITITMFLLVKYKKLGWVGEIFKKQTIKLTSKKWTRRLMILGFSYMIFYGFQLYLIDYAQNENLDQFKSMMISLSLYTGKFNNDDFSSEMKIVNPYTLSLAMINNPSIVTIYFIKNIPSIMFNVAAFAFLGINNLSGNWYSHYNALMFAEEGEGYLLFFFDRKMYRNGMVKGNSWKELGMFENINKLKSFYRIKH